MRRRNKPGSWQRRIFKNYYNLNTFAYSRFRFVGKYDFPALSVCDAVPEKFFPYDERNKWKQGDGAIHFYCEDIEFESVWLRANRHPHVPAVIRHAGVALSPDFSIYTDFPVATQIWNVFRARLLGALWHSEGIDVIPSVSWGLPESFEFCFDGLPIGGTFAVATTYVNDAEERRFFLEGFKEFIRRCQPDTVLVYGRGLRHEIESMHSNIRRYDSRLTMLYEAKKAAKKAQAEAYAKQLELTY